VKIIWKDIFRSFVIREWTHSHFHRNNDNSITIFIQTDVPIYALFDLFFLHDQHHNGLSSTILLSPYRIQISCLVKVGKRGLFWAAHWYVGGFSRLMKDLIFSVEIIASSLIIKHNHKRITHIECNSIQHDE
jgi:hypothetical protein